MLSFLSLFFLVPDFHRGKLQSKQKDKPKKRRPFTGAEPVREVSAVSPMGQVCYCSAGLEFLDIHVQSR